MSAPRLGTILAGVVSLSGDALEAELSARLEEGRAAWPRLALSDADFVRHLATHVHHGELPPQKHAAEMWLSSACVHGVSGAAEAFQRRYRGGIERAAARVDRGVVDEATQVVLMSLLVQSGEQLPRISNYGGRSALSTWLATVTARTALKLVRNPEEGRHQTASSLADPAVADHPDLALTRARYGEEFARALREAVVALDARHRVLLRLHHFEGWSLERLAALYEVSRATLARWLATAREDLYETTKNRLRERLAVTPSELDSLVAFLGASLDVSLVRLLDTPVHDDPPGPGRGT